MLQEKVLNINICVFLCLLCTLQTSLSDVSSTSTTIRSQTTSSPTRSQTSSDVSTPHQCLPTGKCFTVIIDQRLNWNDAEKYCEQNLPSGARLASIHNAFENQVIAAWLPFLSTDPWIGGFQIGSLPYQWSDASAFDYTLWTFGEPSKPCAQFCRNTGLDGGVQCQQGKWRTADCQNGSAQLICEYGTISSTPPPPTVVQTSCKAANGKCFALVAGTLTWTEAEAFCHALNKTGTTATLASINDQADEAIIATFLQFPNFANNMWIGASKLGSAPYSWNDQSPFTYTNWAPGQPPAGSEGCVQVCLKDDPNCVKEKWTVVPCRSQQSFICENLPFPASDCLDLHQSHGELASGTYTLNPQGLPAFTAFCDMVTDGGGWTVFQRRLDGSLSFFDKTWNNYKSGFNNGFDYNMWLGNDYIHVLSTKDPRVELRIDIYGNRLDNTSSGSDYWFGKYTFSIDDEAHFYALRISPPTAGNASISTNSIGYNNGSNFSTVDVNHDNCGGCCSRINQLGGWWFTDCGFASLNGKYVPSQNQPANGFCWSTGNDTINPMESRMMLRRTA